MQKNVKFQLEEAIEIPKWADAYPEHKFTVFKTCFLSTKPNSHGLEISKDVLRKCADSILGNFLVAKLEFGDATTHKDSEIIYGYFPMEQKIEFVEDGDILKAYAFAVVSKRYSKEFNGIFEFDNLRNSSVEMTVETPDDNDYKAESLDIYGLTCLGRRINGSCPDADIKMIRFAKDKAEEYYFQGTQAVNTLKKFVKERKVSMAKSYKIDKSKEAMSTSDWGDVDKASQRDKIMEADNRDTLVKSVYAIVGDGWEDAPSEHLKYPLMELKGDTFVYNRGALSSALAYAKQHNETAVINKVEKIYKELDLDDSDGKEEKEMSEIEFAAVNIGDMWCKLWNALRDSHRDWEYSIHGIYEESNKKFAILCGDGKLYRLDFSFTDEGLTLSDELVEVQEEFVETDNIKKFAEPDDVDKYKNLAESEDDEEDDKDEPEDEEDLSEENGQNISMSEDEMMAKIAELEKTVEEKENIIMDKDKEIQDRDIELEGLRKFKSDVEAKEVAMAVEQILADMTKFMDKDTVENFRKEGLEVEFSQLDAWANKVKASVVDKVVKSDKGDGLFKFSAPVENEKSTSNNVWDRL